MVYSLNRYLRTCKEAARKYGVQGELFHHTETKVVENEVDTTYKTRSMGTGRSRRVLTFDFSQTQEAITGRGFIQPRRVVRLRDSGIYTVSMEYPKRGDSLILEICGDKVDYLEPPMRNDRINEKLHEMSDKAREFTPEQLLRIMAGMYVFGFSRFLSTEGSTLL